MANRQGSLVALTGELGSEKLLFPKMVVILCVRKCKSTASCKAFLDGSLMTSRLFLDYFLIIAKLFLDYSHMIPGWFPRLNVNLRL